MKKLFIFMLFILLFTSCSIKKIDITKENAIETILKSENKLSNTVSPGYKYYLPNEVTLVGRNDYNETFYSKGNYYYLYVDVVSYYNKIKLDYKENKDAYYSKSLNHKNKEGYIEITKKEDIYFIEIMYNYSKIEAYVKESYVDETVLNASYILSSIKFNNILAETKLGNFESIKKEENLNIFVPKREEGTFLDTEETNLKDNEGKDSEL